MHIYGGCSKFFCPNVALGPALGEPCATTVPCEFLVAHVFVPRFRARFRVASYSYNVYTNMCLRVRASSYQKVYVPPFTYIFAYTLYIHMHACVFDRAAWTTGSTLDLKLARFLFAWGDVSTAPAWDCQCGKQKQMQNCHTSIQKHVEETTWHATTQFPLRNLGPALLRETCAMQGFKLPKSSQQTRLLNFKGKVLEWPPCTTTVSHIYIYIHIHMASVIGYHEIEWDA